jgi:transcriptional regulator with GAF, ATPase, and Fis domain
MRDESPPPRTKNAKQLAAIKRLARALLVEARSLEEEQDYRAETGDGREDEAGFYETVKAYEIFLIRSALSKSQGSQARAARLLGLKPTTLNHKIKAYDIRADPEGTERSNAAAAGGCSEP